MPTSPTYPGVYVEELPSSIHTIVGVSTSVTAFIGRAVIGIRDKAVTIHSFEEYTRIFGGLSQDSSMSYAVYQYFLNGGQDAIIVAINDYMKFAKFERTFDKEIKKADPLTNVLQFKAYNPGFAGTDIAIYIEENTLKKPDKILNLFVKSYNSTKDKIDKNWLDESLNLESFYNLSLSPLDPRFIYDFLKQNSNYVVKNEKVLDPPIGVDLQNCLGDTPQQIQIWVPTHLR